MKRLPTIRLKFVVLCEKIVKRIKRDVERKGIGDERLLVE